MSEAVEEPCIVIKKMSGEELAKISPVPGRVGELKQLIFEAVCMPVALQKLLHEDGSAVCADDEVLEKNNQAMTLIQDETPLWYWDSRSMLNLDIDGEIIKCERLDKDYVNVITKEPVAAGLHYFQFHLHHYADEQWCGLTPDPNMAGSEHGKAIPSKNGYMYYTGRGEGALEACGSRLKKAEHVGRSGNIIGMLVDCDYGAAAFDLNGNLQGACEIPKNTPLWVLTHVDTQRDHIELRKPSLQDAPPVNLEALQGALLDVSQGTAMSRSY
eukprot:CAMPEP_0197654178 /NCGR_PEP_ID=MMETSP1338-20131121/38699_1 /TAXON_ID=43686 ORGANISM="Pelagodinium beii, Strain RCC1491" /NCGR_SAMPLE_ID=MMETSP1338 /ASSEMBLY_ACC=CAM_ASM_000754 /LENGTH=270 /DNA_ID=CAMNT_0043229577 /DNA_START=85 /DNA_END=897 /DNA_ORIENTATION=+